MAGSSAPPSAHERELLSAARHGEQAAFGLLVAPYRGELHAHSYRMLGSVQDAEDALQDTLLRAWRGLPRFEGRSSLRSWLYRIATNASLNAIDKRPRRMLPMDHGPAAGLHDAPGWPLTEAVWVEPYPDEQLGLQDGRAAPEARYERREGVELAFIAALQHLAPKQRAVLILREVLGFSAAEVADTLDTTVASVNSAMQRARATIDDKLPERSQQATLRSLGDGRVREIVEDFIDAWERADVDAVVALLADEPTWSMPPVTTWYRGRETVAAFLAEWPMRERWRRVPAHANGQLAVGCYMWKAERGAYAAHVLDVLTLEGGRIREVTGFIMPELFGRFGLPDELPATDE